MKKWIVLLIIICLLPIKVKAFDTSATSAILMDIDSKRILYSKDIHNVRSVASISKIMTAILAIESEKLNDTIIIDEAITKAYGSAIYIRVGEEIKLEDLVYGLMLRSGNDAALAIASYVSGNVEKFAELMNKKAKEIGMKNTTFNNPSGLDEEIGNYSTAYDMAILTSYAMQNETYKKIVGTKKHTVKTNMNYYSWTNKNKLLSLYKYTTGGKTGYTEKAKRTLVTTSSKDNLNLVVVTLNDGNDFEDHINLFKEAYDTYQNYTILKKGNINVLRDNYYENNSLYIEKNFTYPLLETEKNNIILKINLEKGDKSNNKKVGNVEVKIDDKVIYEDSIYYKEQVIKKKSFFKKIIDWIKSL